MGATVPRSPLARAHPPQRDLLKHTGKSFCVQVTRLSGNQWLKRGRGEKKNKKSINRCVERGLQPLSCQMAAGLVRGHRQMLHLAETWRGRRLSQPRGSNAAALVCRNRPREARDMLKATRNGPRAEVTARHL